MRLAKTWLLVFVVLGLICALIIYFVELHASSDNVISRADKIMDINPRNKHWFFWMSDDDMVIIYRKVMRNFSPASYIMQDYNIKTRRSSSLQGANHSIRRSNLANIILKKGDQDTKKEEVLLNIVGHTVKIDGINIKLPSKMKVDDFSLSPTRDRLIWLLYTESNSPFSAFLQHILPSYKQKKLITVDIWLSRSNGTQMYRIGSLGTPSSGYQPRLHDLQWLPSGKEISFIYNDALYKLPVH